MTISSNLRILALSLVLVGCGGASESESEAGTVEKQENMELRYGGVFRMPISSFFSLGFPNEVKKLDEYQVYSQVFEGLVKYNTKTLEIEPALAKEWHVSDDGLVYTFLLRDDVYFHDNPCFENGVGRKVTAEDVVYTFHRIFNSDLTNSAYTIFKNTVVGGDDYHNGKTDSISGVTANGNEVIVNLQAPSLTFIQKLADIYGVIMAKESIEATEFVPVGTGPFIYDNEGSNSEKVRLVRNPNYHGVDVDGNKLPYLDSVVFTYYEDKAEQMDLFWSEELTFIPKVPIPKISEVMDERMKDFESKPPKFILSSEPELTTTYLELNMKTSVLKKKKVRQALNYAIDRKKLVARILKNQAYEIGKFGITPPLPKVFSEYDFEGIEDVSYVYNPELAKQLLAEAGYPGGENFPSLEMQFAAGGTEYLVASEIQSQLRSVLNINIGIEAIEFNQLLENQAMGKADIFRTNWIGDYASPETFLANAYGKIVPRSRKDPSYLNSSRYSNPEFDELFEKGVMTTDPAEAYQTFGEAEKILMEDSPFIILWYGEDMMLKQANVQRFETNGIGYINLGAVFFRDSVSTQYADKM